MKIIGISIVRNESTILRINILHHLAQGLDEYWFVDNGSTDQTPMILESFRGSGAVRWHRESGPFRQVELTNGLVREAMSRGADWVLVIDADEFWHAPGSRIRDVLAASDAGALEVNVINYVQRRRQRKDTLDALLFMTRRPDNVIKRGESLVQDNALAFIEADFTSKWVFRPAPDVSVSRGNHVVNGLAGRMESCPNIVCRHAALRSQENLLRKVEHGKRIQEIGDPLAGDCWQHLRWERLTTDEAMDMEWRANSYDDRGLDVYGKIHPVVYDPTLRNLVRPWIQKPWWKRTSPFT